MSHFTTFLCLASLVNPFRSVTLLEKRLETLILIIAILLAFSSSNVYSQLNLFGLTPEGGTNGHGVIFSYDPVTNTYTKKHDFDSTNGRYASSSLFQASNGKLYGTTRFGGSNDLGVLFEYDPATSTYAKKFDFGGSDGAVPFGTLAQAADGNLYGTASEGGSSNVGVLFEYDPVTEIYTKKLDFDGTNGANPWNSLMKATNGKFYGTTGNGGTSGAGVIFEYDPATSSYTKLYDFDYTNGADPRGTPMQATNGKLYGVTVGGGASGLGVFWEFGLPSTYTKKFDFNGTNGSIPHHGPLLQATNGKIYGMTLTGGSDGVGVLFQYDIASDTDTTLVDFLEGSTNGNRPFG
ncbi:MAG: hypothetical protein HYZ34_07000, partial [Ignavibacteriae bacterium]|nr:hypothetical protein [Ignavibacteriota bacterium]